MTPPKLPVTAIFALYLIGAQALKPEEFFKICHRKDPNLDKCLIDSLHRMRPHLKAGIPQLKISSLDPMSVPKISVNQGSGPVSIDSTFTNMKIYGMTDYTVTKVVPKLDNYRIDFEGTLPALYNEGGYEINGKVLILPISGQGPSYSNYSNRGHSQSDVGRFTADEGQQKYMKVDDFKFDLDVKNALIQMDNLFNGNKELGDAMNKFMSENWEAVFKELKPVINEAVSALLKDVAVKVFDKFPLDQLLPN